MCKHRVGLQGNVAVFLPRVLLFLCREHLEIETDPLAGRAWLYDVINESCRDS